MPHQNIKIYFKTTFRRLFYLGYNCDGNVSIKPTSKINGAIDVVRRIMKKRNYALYDGSIYRLAPDAKFTFVFCSNVKDFILNMLGNTEVADIILPYVQMITGLLSEPACRLIEPISMDMNLIEVLPAGVCFNINNKRFELMDKMKDCTSPRAFVRYQYKEGHVPYPQKFVEGM